MLGLATRLVIAERTIARLETERPADAELVKANKPWFMLGALGPALGDFVPWELPAQFGAPGRTPYYAAWKAVLEIAVGNPSTSPPLPGVVPTLRTLLGTLNKLIELVKAHDFNGVVALRDSGALDVVNAANADLATIIQNFSQVGVLQQIAKTLGSGSRPRIDDPLNHVNPSYWTGRDYLHWKQTGAFASRLLHDAKSANDDRLLAYAYGWQVAFASLVCSSGFLASIVGSVYRTHWWRTRWIANFVDAWTWGYYRRGAAAEDAYDQWPSLCNADLHEWIEVKHLVPEAVATAIVTEGNLPDALPAEFVTYWLGAWTAVYQAHDSTVESAPLFDEKRLQAAYLMTWLVLWFQTSGDVIGCNPAPGSPPSACGDNPQPPNWDDPTQTNPLTGLPFTPPTPDAHHDARAGEVACGIILALLGLVATCFGFGAVGLPAIFGGIVLAIDGEKQLNWDDLECQLYWLTVYVFGGLGALHKLTVIGGFQHAYAPELAAATEKVTFGALSYEFATAAEETCRSRWARGPLQVWNGALLDWTARPPAGPLEEPEHLLWWDVWWPSAIVDDDTANPGQVSIFDTPPSFDAGVKGSFGPAVQAAIKLIAEHPAALPNWNLDGDRGHGWLTWELDAPYSVPVKAHAES